MEKTSHPIREHSVGRSFLFLLIGAVCIGFAPIFAKLALETGKVSPAAAGFWRMFFGSLCLSLIWSKSFAALKMTKSEWKKTGWFFALPGFCFAGDLSLWHWSFEFTSIANAAILANLAAIFVPMIGYFFFGERLGIKFFLGALVAFLGLVWLIFSGHQNILNGHTHEDQMFGDFLGLITAFFYSGYLLTTKKYLNRYPTSLIMIFSSGWAAVFLIIVSLARGGNILPQTREGWLYCFLLGAVSQMTGQGLVAVAMQRLSASVSSVTLLLAPLFSSIFGVYILSQGLSFIQILSAFVVMGGIGYATLQYRTKRP